MIFDWGSFFIGVAVGLIFMNVSFLISSYIKLRKSKAALAASTAKLNEINARLEQRKQEIYKSIKKVSE